MFSLIHLPLIDLDLELSKSVEKPIELHSTQMFEKPSEGDDAAKAVSTPKTDPKHVPSDTWQKFLTSAPNAPSGVFNSEEGEKDGYEKNFHQRRHSHNHNSQHGSGTY